MLGSLWLSLSAASVMALTKDPLRFSPVYVVQMAYKSIWLTGAVLPRLIAGDLHSFDALSAVIMISFVVMDYLYLPWDYILNGTVPTGKKE